MDLAVSFTHAGIYQYFLKVVPTSYTTLRNETTQSNQYSVTEHFRPLDEGLMAANNLPPSIVFFYDMSAIKVWACFVLRRSQLQVSTCSRRSLQVSACQWSNYCSRALMAQLRCRGVRALAASAMIVSGGTLPAGQHCGA